MYEQLAAGVRKTLIKDWEPLSRSRLHFLVKWSTRDRKPVLKDRHARRLHERIPAICEERGIPLAQVAVEADRVHLLFGLRPSESVAGAVRELKSRAGLDLMSAFPELRVRLGGNLIWDDRYEVETLSAARLSRTRERLRSIEDWSEPLAQAS